MNVSRYFRPGAHLAGCGLRAMMLIAMLASPMARAAEAPASGQKILELMGELTRPGYAEHKAAISALGHSHDRRALGLLEDYNQGNVYQWKGRLVLGVEIRTDSSGTKLLPLIDPLTREPIEEGGKQVMLPMSDAKSISPSRRERLLLRDAINLLNLSDPDPEARLTAVVRSGDGAVVANLPILKEMLTSETDAKVHRAIEESIALTELSTVGDDPESVQTRIQAAQKLGELSSLRSQSKLADALKKTKDPKAAAVYRAALERVEHWQNVTQWVGYGFAGLSLGSILVLMALGLAIIFGLMGVINMAHGELMMIGAYATYLTQQFFVNHLSKGAFDWYFVAAIPLAFLAAALVGMLIEVLVIRHLYGRPLDTLLATCGVSLVLIQAVRVWFGNNIAVNSPSWLQKGFEIAPDIVLPYNRLFIIGFCIACIILMYWITNKTKLGLLLRATVQNREMAAALGVKTRRVDMLTFGLGAGLAGLAGCALTQIGGVTPDMGQNYIVDSFMVVVTGGVGKLAGVIISGLGLGSLNKLFEPLVQAVWAKVFVLLFVIIFIQWRPSGLFPAKGRNADA